MTAASEIYESKEHKCNWSMIPGTNRLICNKCNVVSDIDTLLANATASAYKKAQVDLLSRQLYARDLKKSARDKAYAWVRSNTSESVLIEDRQQNLFIPKN